VIILTAAVPFREYSNRTSKTGQGGVVVSLYLDMCRRGTIFLRGYWKPLIRCFMTFLSLTKGVPEYYHEIGYGRLYANSYLCLLRTFPSQSTLHNLRN